MVQHLKRKTFKKTFANKALAVQRHNIGLLFTLPILLTVIGLFFIFEASSVTAFRQLGDSFYFFRQQLIWCLLGICAMTFFSYFDYKKLYYFAFPLLLISLVFLVAVLIPGIGSTVYGARRWINFGFFSFQPTELAKISVILYLSSWFLYKDRKRFLHFILILASMIGLVMMQPDLGTSIIIFSLFISIYFLSGEKLKYLYGLLPIALVGIVGLILASPYRLRRLMSFLDPKADPQGVSYHINQILISLSSGGIFGRGFSNSRQKYQFLPEAHTDSIFAIIGEEVGFIGSVLLIMVYLLLLYSLYQVAVHSKDRFGFLLTGSILTLMSLHAVINLGGMTAIMPLTGVPLPFISYGGSSLVIFYSLMGIVISVARRNH